MCVCVLCHAWFWPGGLKCYQVRLLWLERTPFLSPSSQRDYDALILLDALVPNPQRWGTLGGYPKSGIVNGLDCIDMYVLSKSIESFEPFDSTQRHRTIDTEKGK